MSRKKRPAIQDLACERALIASVVHYAHKSLPLARDIVTEGDFWDYRHTLAWRVVCKLYDTQQKIDAYTVGAAASTMGATVPDTDYLLALKDDDFVIQNVDAYAERVAKTAIVRRTRDELSKLVESTDHSRTGADEWLVNVEAFRQTKQASIAGEASVRNFSDVASEVLALLDSGAPEPRLTSGFPTLDTFLNGGYPAGLHLVAARPGGGKSVVLQQTAVAWAKCQPLPVLFVSMEMNERDVQRRMAAQEGGVPFTDIMRSKIAESDHWHYRQTVHDIGKLPIRILYAGNITVQRIVVEASLMAKTSGIAGVVVDYIGLVQWGDKSRKFDNRREVVGEVTHALMALANNLRIPVLAAVQMNRAIEGRSGDPKLSDLRECGDLEQDAYTVLFPIAPPQDAHDQSDGRFVLAKHRNGPVGAVRMMWQGKFVRFLDV